MGVPSPADDLVLSRIRDVFSPRLGGGQSRSGAIRLLAITIVSIALALPFVSAATSTSYTEREYLKRPNIIFLIDESTDGRTYRPAFKAIDLINIRRLFAKDRSTRTNSTREFLGTSAGLRRRASTSTTVQFDTHYVTTPVCAASRASIWSGKYPHRIPHLQAQTGMEVRGAWNNFEGLPNDYNNKIQDVLERSGDYEIQVSGKTDWITGGHSLSNRVMAWNMYTYFPYNTTNHQAGFYNEGCMCTGNGTIHPKDFPNKGGYYHGDWDAVNKTTAWIRARGREQALALEQRKSVKPFFVYQGMNIVHPAYVTTSYWYNKVNHSAVTAPAWKDLQDLHPCDFQSTMLKGCLPQNASQAPFVYSIERRKRIRAIYYAMILEFDSMVGAYLDALESVPGLAENTVVIVTSDHGDMNMEHQQFYKEVPYDASSRVPLIIKVPANFQKTSQIDNDHEPLTSRNDKGSFKVNPFVTQPTSHVDLFPTIMDLAGIPKALRPKGLHGESLMPFLVTTIPFEETSQDVEHITPQNRENTTTNLEDAETLPELRKRPFAVNQFHGADIAMSWFSIIDANHYKYTVFGTGDQHEPQLFDLKNDPDEAVNLATDSNYESTIRRLDDLLQTVVNYREVAQDVAEYAHTSLRTWVNTTSDWKIIIQTFGWKRAFVKNANASIKAIEAYLEGPPRVYECRSERVWPPEPLAVIALTS